MGTPNFQLRTPNSELSPRVTTYFPPGASLLITYTPRHEIELRLGHLAADGKFQTIEHPSPAELVAHGVSLPNEALVQLQVFAAAYLAPGQSLVLGRVDETETSIKLIEPGPTQTL